MGIHHHYATLLGEELAACDAAAQAVMDTLRAANLPADGADPAERMTEAIARFIVESRDRPMPRPLPPSLENVEPVPLHFEHMGMCYYRVLGTRCPRKGEYYRSGAVVAAYRAGADMHHPYSVVVPVYHAVRKNPVTGDAFRRGDAVTVPARG